jgi:hypothetical protein
VERHEIMELLGQLKLAGMRAAYDEVVAAGVRAQHSFQHIFGELLLAQLADHRARSTAYCQSALKFHPGSARNIDPDGRRSGARGRCLFAHRGKPGWYSGAIFEAPAVVPGFDDIAMMGKAIEQRRGHLGVAEDGRPFRKGQVGSDDD